MNKTLLDGKPYVRSGDTDVSKTFRAFGFRPTTEAERKARQKRMHEPPAEPANVTPIETKKRKHGGTK